MAMNLISMIALIGLFYIECSPRFNTCKLWHKVALFGVMILLVAKG